MKYYKRLIVIVLLVSCISGMAIYFTGDINTLRHLNDFRPWSIFLALVFLSLGMYFDSTRLVTLARMAGTHITLFQSLQVILSNYFLAMLTPGATGGPVVQIFLLRQMGMSTGQAAVIVLVRTILSILLLIVCLPVVVYTDAALVPWLPPNVAALAAAILAAVSVGGIWLVRTNLMKRLALWIAMQLSHPLRRKVWKMHCDVQASVNMLVASPKGMAKVFIDTGLSLLALYSIVPALFIGLDISVDWPIVLGRMILLNLVLYFAPTPGGTGVAEGGFVMLFSSLTPPGTVGFLAVAWRILAEYLPFAAGLYFTLKALGGKLLDDSESKLLI